MFQLYVCLRYGYKCDAIIDDPSSPLNNVTAKVAATMLLNASSFEYSLKPFAKEPVGLDDSYEYEKTITGCCQCEPHSMPEFFNQVAMDPGFLDNKHEEVQIAISALKDTELTVCFELMHGQFYHDFEVGMKRLTTYRNGSAELFVHLPYRAKYTSDKQDPKSAEGKLEHASFLSLLKMDNMEDTVMMPLNLPRQYVRDPQSLPSSDYTVGYR